MRKGIDVREAVGEGRLRGYRLQDIMDGVAVGRPRLSMPLITFTAIWQVDKDGDGNVTKKQLYNVMVNSPSLSPS